MNVSSRPGAELDAIVAKGDFDLVLGPSTADDAALATEGWIGRAGPWFDVLAEAARQADGQAEKRPLYVELQRIWSDALPALPLYQRLRVDIAVGTLTGIQPPPRDEALTWNVAEWRFSTP